MTTLMSALARTPTKRLLSSRRIHRVAQTPNISTSRSSLPNSRHSVPVSFLSRRAVNWLFTAALSTISSKSARHAPFLAAYARITDELTGELRKEGIPENVISRYKENLDYNVPNGKLNRGMAVVDSVEIIKRRPLSEDEYTKAAVLGWCLELLNAYFIVADDIMDASLTRRDQPCWYRSPGIGMVAINDSAMLSSAIYRLLKAHFKTEPYYIDLIELFLESTWQTEVGQLIDAVTAPENVHVNLSNFSLELHSLTAFWKAGYYSCYLPVASAMHMCGIPDILTIPSPDQSKPLQSPYEIAKSILLLLGHYGQTNNDYLDYAGTVEETRKIGTDIINNKASWCINTALLHATPAQRRVLDENYGKGESGGMSESKIKAVFEEIGIRERYIEYERNIVGLMRQKIAEIPEAEQENILRRELFEKFLGRLYKEGL